MKKTGLSNRFSSETRNVWLYWNSCLICGMNQWDSLHHVISPSSHLYKAGRHNTSVLNSCPIHNLIHPYNRQKSCHVGNEAHLYKDETIKELLKDIRFALEFELGYELNELDLEFVDNYVDLYL